jgi:hypothetical protein
MGFSDICCLADRVDPRRETLSSTMEPKELMRQTIDLLGEIQGRMNGSSAFSTTARQKVIARL